MTETKKSWSDAVGELPFVGTFVRAAKKSNVDYNKDMAASVAFFGFFSLFPLLTAIIAGASVFLKREEIQSRLDRMLADEFPGSADFLRTNLEALIDLRGAAGLASVAGLLWSASKLFGALSRGINLALGIPKDHPFYLSKLRHFGMTIFVSLLLLAGIGVSMFVDVVQQFDLFPDALGSTAFAALSSQLASVFFVFGTVAIIYKIVPYERPAWREVLPTALVVAVLFEAGKALFVLYLEKASSFEAVYGSLSSVIVLLLWLYLSARLLLFGTELIAVRR
jgi:membrane protein